CGTCCWSRGGLVVSVSYGSGGTVSSPTSLFWWSRGVLDSTLSVLDRCVFFLVVVVATGLRCGGGGCDGSEMEVMR
ncbi:hypothetical protein A2U01_0100259, partial [Trifolium medium]|nr:hypothetical protein [Trifolium medium]